MIEASDDLAASPVAHALHAWKTIKDDWSKNSTAPLTLHCAAVAILAYVFEGAKRRRVLERRVDALEQRLNEPNSK
jgi:hypothetical protein